MKRPSTITGILLECVDVESFFSESKTITLAGAHYMSGQRISLNDKTFIVLGIKTTMQNGLVSSELTLLPDDDPE